MAEMISISREEKERLEERVRKSAMEKSYLQLIIRLMNRISMVTGLENVIENMLREIAGVIGGTNIILYYRIDEDLFRADAYGKKEKIAGIDDPVVAKAFECREAGELVGAFSETKMISAEFGKAYTWVSPLVAGGENIGVLKMENLHVSMRDLYTQLQPFFGYVAMTLKNEMLGRSRLKLMNEKLEKDAETLLAAKKKLVELVQALNTRSMELKQANEKLLEVDRLKSMFIASMSHELRTPLNSIIGFSSIVLKEWCGPVNKEQAENLSTILAAARHLLMLINDVIDVSKIEAGKLESIVEDFDLGDLVGAAIGMIKSERGGNGLEFSAAPVSLAMHTDRRRLLQCLINLLSNAAKFTLKGGVTVSVAHVKGTGKAAAPDRVAITVTDTGIGIREEDIPRLFSPFVRLASPLAGRTKGTGLGLYLVKKIAAEILNGEVSVKSVYEKGSEFTIDIPVRLDRGA